MKTRSEIEEEEENLKCAFNLVDGDKDGKISPKDLKQNLKCKKNYYYKNVILILKH